MDFDNDDLKRRLASATRKIKKKVFDRRIKMAEKKRPKLVDKGDVIAIEGDISRMKFNIQTLNKIDTMTRIKRSEKIKF